VRLKKANQILGVSQTRMENPAIFGIEVFQFEVEQ